MKFWRWLKELYDDLRFPEPETDFTGLSQFDWGDR